MNDHKPMHTSIYIHFVKHYTLVGGFNPSEKYVSQLGCYSIPNIWKVSQNSMVPNHQPVRVWQCWIYWMSSLRWHQMCLAGNPAMARQLGPLGPGGRWTPRNRWNSNTRTWARRKAYTTSLSLFFRSQMRAPWCWNMHTNIYPNNSSPSHVSKYTSTMVRIWDGWFHHIIANWDVHPNMSHRKWYFCHAWHGRVADYYHRLRQVYVVQTVFLNKNGMVIKTT